MSAWINAIQQLPNMPARLVYCVPKGIRAAHYKRAAWSDADCDYLEQYYPIRSNTELSTNLGRGKETVRVQANNMGLNKMFGRNKPPGEMYKEVIDRVNRGESHAMIIMSLKVTQDEIDHAIRHFKRYGL